MQKIGKEKLRQHCLDLLTKRVSVKLPNDGKQTPFNGHPVFKAQHALALCCRGCMQKWYNISQEQQLSSEHLNIFTNLVMNWIEKESAKN